MKFKKSDLAKIFQDLGSKEKIEDVRLKAAEILKDLESDYDEHEQVVNQNNQYKNDIEDLQKTNNKLFKLVGSPADPEKEKSPGKTDDEDEKTLTYEGLFNEKGELK